MIPSPILFGVTPDGGLILAVTGDDGDLAGLTLHGQHGPEAAVELSTDGGATWTAVAYPHLLSAGEQLRLTRSETGSALTTIRASFPDGGIPESGGGATAT